MYRMAIGMSMLMLGCGSIDPVVCRQQGGAPRALAGSGWACATTTALPNPQGNFTFSPSVPRSGDAPAQVVIEVGQVGPAVQVGPAIGGRR